VLSFNANSNNEVLGVTNCGAFCSGELRVHGSRSIFRALEGIDFESFDIAAGNCGAVRAGMKCCLV